MQCIESNNLLYSAQIEIDQDHEIDYSDYWDLEICYNGHIRIGSNSGEFEFVATNMSVVEFAGMCLAWIVDWEQNHSDFNCDSEDDGQIFIWIRQVNGVWHLGSDVFQFPPHKVQVRELQKALWYLCISLHDKLISDYEVSKMSEYHQGVIRRFQLAKPFGEATD